MKVFTCIFPLGLWEQSQLVPNFEIFLPCYYVNYTKPSKKCAAHNSLLLVRFGEQKE